MCHAVLAIQSNSGHLGKIPNFSDLNWSQWNNFMKNVIQKFLWAIAVFSLVSSPSGWTEAPESPSIGNLAIPENLGKIEERFEGTSPRWVIQIRDVHAHFTAQENMAAIVDHINSAYGINKVALEGGWSESNFPESWSLPLDRNKQMLARALLEESHIGGPVHAALFSKIPLTVVGIEDADLYERNLDIYLKHLNNRKFIVNKLGAVLKEINLRKITIFNPSLLTFDRALNEFRNGEKAEKFLPSLVQQADTQSVDLSSYKQVLIFKEILQKEKEIDKEKLEKEAERLMLDFKNSRLSFEEVLRGGKILPEKLQYYPQTRAYLELMKLQDQISHGEFFEQIDQVVIKVEDTLFVTDEERALAERSARFHIARAIILFQATPDNIAAYEKDRAAIEADLSQVGLAEAAELGLSFYALAHERDKVFFEKIKSDSKLQGNIMLVTGGFHTEGLSYLLKEAQISYVVITPEIREEAPNEELYFKRLQDAVPRVQTLSHEQNRFVFLDANFPAAVQVLRNTNNILSAVETASRYQMTSSGTSAEPAANEGAGLTLAALQAMGSEERLSKAREIFQSAQAGKLPIAIVIKTSTLSQLLTKEINGIKVGLILFDQIIAPESMNKLVIIRDSDEFVDATIGIAARIISVNTDIPIGDVIKTRLQNQKNIAVIDGEYIKEVTARGILNLPAEPVSFLLARLLLENGPQVSTDPEFLAAFENEIVSMLVADDIVRQYA